MTVVTSLKHSVVAPPVPLQNYVSWVFHESEASQVSQEKSEKIARSHLNTAKSSQLCLRHCGGGIVYSACDCKDRCDCSRAVKFLKNNLTGHGMCYVFCMPIEPEDRRHKAFEVGFRHLDLLRLARKRIPDRVDGIVSEIASGKIAVEPSAVDEITDDTATEEATDVFGGTLDVESKQLEQVAGENIPDDG
ncbi:hypothetical protein TTRE_0000654001 [Trichuris trichiura]|uniref:Uncharacterized protein n=1 Tax=Trichuris trichiura TaxID=36087 RepID=A0A077ZFE1_TRITR|nr:hypothetical protein TTRE_0000654001 [Trichuris trichiura]